MAHDLERGAEEAIADLRRIHSGDAAHARAADPAGAGAGAGAGIELMAEDDTDGRADRAAGYQSEQATHRFSDPLHTLIY